MVDGIGADGPAFGRSVPEAIRVLHVDDDPAFLELAADFLARELPDADVLTAESAAAGLSILGRERVDCVVSDYDMPGRNGLEFLGAVREEFGDLPFILFTGKGSEEIASDAISAGVTDYLQKDTGTEQYAVLANRIEGYVDRKRTADALAESRRRLSRLIGNLPGIVYRCLNEPDWPMVFVSDGCAELTGYPPRALESGDVRWGRDVIGPEDRDEVWETVQAALESGERFEVTYRIHTADGEERLLWEQGVGVFDDDGEVEALEGFITDVTERAALDSDRKELAQRLEAIVRASPEPIVALDREGRVTLWNEAAEETFGWSEAEIIGEAVPLVPEERADEHLEIVATGVEEEIATRTQTVRRTESGEEIVVDLSTAPLYGPDGDVVGLVGVLRDLTDRLDLESALLETAQRLEAVVDASPDPLMALDREGRVTLWNEAAEETFGYRAEEVLGEPLPIVPDDHYREYLGMRETVLGGEVIEDMEVVRSTKAGEEVVVSVTNAPVYGPQDEVVGSMAVVRDLRDRRTLESKLRDTAERLETVVNASPQPIVALDREGRVTLWNEAAEETFGWRADEVLGEPYPAVPEDERTQHEDLVRNVEAGTPASDVEIVRRTKDGERLTLSISSGPLHDADGEVIGTMAVLTDLTELRGRERAADFSRQLVEKVGVGVAVYGEDGRFVYANDHAADLLGCDVDDIVGTPIWAFNPGFDPDRLAGFWESIAPGETEYYEIDMQQADGTTVPVEAVITREDIQGTAYHFGTVRDISQRLALDAELRETARRLQAVVDASPEAIVAVGPDGRVILWNAAAEAMFGTTAAAAHGEDLDVLPPTIATHLRARLAESSAGGARADAELVADTVDGTRIDVSVATAPLGDPDADLAGLMAVIDDVGDLREHERLVTSLHEATQELMTAETARAIADLVVETTTSVLGHPYTAVLLWDDEIDALRVVADTPEAREKTLSPPEVMERGEGVSGTVYDTGEPVVIEDRHTSEWTIAQADTGVRSASVIPLGEHGVYVLSSDLPGEFDDRDVEVAKLLAANAEAALDRARREGELRHREVELERQNERLERFASVLSHDLRNPLNVALGRLRMIEADRDDLAAVERAVERMDQIVEDVLAIAREGQSVGDPDPVRIDSVVTGAWAAVDTGSGEVECSVSRTVSADAGRLGRLFENLFRNAVDHGGPEVHVRVGSLPGGFYVEDDGPGIPPGDREAVFEFGHTTSESGTGYGLAIVKEIAEAHGWTVAATAGRDGGARFEVTGVEWLAD